MDREHENKKVSETETEGEVQRTNQTAVTTAPSPQSGEDEPDELADRHDGTKVQTRDVQAQIQTRVTVDSDDLPDLAESIGMREYAKRVAISRVEDRIMEYEFGASKVIAEEKGEALGTDERVYEVWVEV